MPAREWWQPVDAAAVGCCVAATRTFNESCHCALVVQLLLERHSFVFSALCYHWSSWRFVLRLNCDRIN